MRLYFFDLPMHLNKVTLISAISMWRMHVIELRGDLKTQPAIDLRFHPVPGGYHMFSMIATTQKQVRRNWELGNLIAWKF